ncbi:hypothetical protein SteCoe_16624 [Stentor coeruleus]|uniref:Uncharacterized protein n=1 Tax=Stentor coeruleus TaxID=5963 RepID=A0A1R2C0W6_9CILI|nr:hypothetical protein SteCoe_16624 [Stentor coeruleus]
MATGTLAREDTHTYTESISSYCSSIISINLTEDNKRSTCPSEDLSGLSSSDVLNIDTSSMITISSWSSKLHKISMLDPLTQKPCACIIS